MQGCRKNFSLRGKFRTGSGKAKRRPPKVFGAEIMETRAFYCGAPSFFRYTLLPLYQAVEIVRHPPRPRCRRVKFYYFHSIYLPDAQAVRSRLAHNLLEEIHATRLPRASHLLPNTALSPPFFVVLRSVCPDGESTARSTRTMMQDAHA